MHVVDVDGLVRVEHETLERGSEGEVCRQVDGGSAVEHDDSVELEVRQAGEGYVLIALDASLVHFLHIDISGNLFDFVEDAILSQQRLEGGEFGHATAFRGNPNSVHLR